MVEKPKSTAARELAARALCRFEEVDEELIVEGQPAWESYLPAADAVLEAIGWAETDLISVYRMRQIPPERE